MIGRLIVEAIGTFFLVFTIGQTVKGPDAAAIWRRWRSGRR